LIYSKISVRFLQNHKESDIVLSFSFYFSLILAFISLPINCLEISAFYEVPAAYHGRFRPVEAIINQHSNEIDLISFKMLPGKLNNGDWFPLNDLKTKKDNFTLYPNSLFTSLQFTYNDFLDSPNPVTSQKLADLLLQGYQPLAGRTYTQGASKALTYPTQSQLSWEAFYFRYPLVQIIACFYLLTAAFLYYQIKGGIPLLILTFLFHTCVLGLRCYILQRPPVSNMFETLLYVPWVTVAISLTLLRDRWTKIAAAFIAASFLLLVNFTNLDSGLENVQAVLDSQYWLIIHVLMVVGSYGLFILAGILGHIYLLRPNLLLQRFIEQGIYLGAALLIPGTILGGVWAAQSWGRFWDWDPKESWAFISICVYLLIIHSWRFHRIGPRGLALGSALGLQVIGFTWYGVNYILGTGLHSYGFGAGGEGFYYFFILCDLIFLTYVWTSYSKKIG